MIRVITNSMGSGDWIVVKGHGGTELFSGHSVSANDLHVILDLVSRDGCELIEVNDEELEIYTD